MISTAPAGTDFVVRSRGGWSIGTVPGDDLRPGSLDELLGLVAAADGAAWTGLRPGRVPEPPAPVDPATVRVSGAWTWVGRVVAGGVLVEAPNGVGVLLDATDLAWLDAVPAGGAGVDLSGVPGLVAAPDAAQRLAVLVGAGLLSVVGAGPVPAGPVVAPVPAGGGAPPTLGERAREAYRLSSKVARIRDAYRLSSKLAPVRRAVSRRSAAPAGPPVVSGAPVPPPAAAPAPSVAVPAAPAAPGPDGRIPVYAIWHERVGPQLALGMLTAYARVHDGGRLNDHFEIRRPERADAFLADLARRRGPAVLLCSDYVWSVDDNLAVAAEAFRANPELVVVHGGPSCPKYEGEAEDFLRAHPDAAHVLVRGEGEVALAELLGALVPTLPDLDAGRLADVAGLSFLDPSTDRFVRTAERERIADLDALPSPYLTGEFDDISAESWNFCLSIETNRGCPYGCTFCDWGSSTLSRIRKFDLDRVVAELEWAARLGVQAVDITDANFGIMSRDVEVADRLADIRRRTGAPQVVAFYPAKNTTKHLVRIMDLLGDAGITSAASLSLQTTDPDTLDALDRSNIPTDHFVRLAADYRRRGHPLQGDLLLGMPGQTPEAYRRDLQFMLDHEILVRTWPLQVLPNAPMNAPEYRELHGIVVDERKLVASTSSFDPADRARMLQLRNLDIVLERFGVLRHVLRYVQWEHGIEATEVMVRLLDLLDARPGAYPLVEWVVRRFDLVPTVPVGWAAFTDEVVALLCTELGVPADAGLATVVEVQRFLLPAPGRRFPAELVLEHDYVSYYRDATASLFLDGHATGPVRPLVEYGPAVLRVEGDPLGLCTDGVHLSGDSRDEKMQGEFAIGANYAYELDSPLLRLTAFVAQNGIDAPWRGPDPDGVTLDPAPSARPVAVQLAARG